VSAGLSGPGAQICVVGLVRCQGKSAWARIPLTPLRLQGFARQVERRACEFVAAGRLLRGGASRSPMLPGVASPGGQLSSQPTLRNATAAGGVASHAGPNFSTGPLPGPPCATAAAAPHFCQGDLQCAPAQPVAGVQGGGG
jgi:hypothetical protein